MPQQKRKGSEDLDEVGQKQAKVRFRATTDSVPFVRDLEEQSILDPREEEWMQNADVRTLSINCHHQSIAAAYYDNSTQTLSMLEDTQDSPSFDLLQTLIEQLSPSFMLVNANAHEKLLDKLMEYCDEHDETTVQICASKDFYVNASLNRLSSVHILRTTPTLDPIGSPGSGVRGPIEAGSASPVSSTIADPASNFNLHPQDDLHRREILNRLGCFTSLEAFLALGAAGSLLIQLERAKAALDDHGPIVFRNVQALATQLHMQINSDALSSLSIFSSASIVRKGSNKQDEDLSLFGVLNTCRSGLGSQILRRWMMRPLLSLPHIKARHQAVEVLIKAENRQVLKSIRDGMKAIKNVHYVFSKMNSGDLSDWTCWRNLAELLNGSLLIVETIGNLRGWESVEICKQIQATCNRKRLRDLFTYITDRVDIDASQTESRLIACQGHDDKLDEINSTLESMEAVLNEAADIAKTEIPQQYNADVKVVMFPQLGYLVEVMMEQADIPQVPLQYQFSSETSSFFKSDSMRELDANYGDIYNEVNDRTIELLETVLEEVSKNASFVLEVVELLSELDCLLAFAAAALDFQLIRPGMHHNNAIHIKGGRHILYERVTENYVSNDTALFGRGDSRDDHPMEADDEHVGNIMMITGANGSGKSAYAKQVALIVYMAQIGCFVPATSADLGVIDKIYTRLQTRESALRSGSAFMIDLSQVSMALRGATARSLLIIDEFGKGTNPQDGAGLLAGLTQTLLKRGKDCPKTIIVTHFHDLAETDNDGIVKMHMESVFQENYEGTGFGEIMFIYRLQPHSSHSSNAAECALQYGLNEELVERARTVTTHLKNFELGKISDVAKTDTDRKELFQAEELAKVFLKWKPLEDESLEDGEMDAKAKLAAMIKKIEDSNAT